MFDPEPSDDFDDADDADISDNDNDNDNDDDNDDDDNDDDDDGIFGECDSADKRRTAAGQSKPLLTSIACNPLKSIACTFNPLIILINTPSCQISGGNQKELKEEPAQRQLQKTSLPNTPQSPAPTQKRGTTWIHLLWLKMANSVFGIEGTSGIAF